MSRGISANRSVRGAFFSILLLILLAMGWIMNLVAFCKCDFEPAYKAEALRGVGIFVAPVGVILGYIDIEDGNNE